MKFNRKKGNRIAKSVPYTMLKGQGKRLKERPRRKWDVDAFFSRSFKLAQVTSFLET